MSSINFARALCLTVTAAVAVASFTAPASARWGGQNERHDNNRGQQGWNNGGNYGNYYAPPPVVYQQYGNNGYYAPPLVYGSGINLNIGL
jgi:hypothetical protein